MSKTTHGDYGIVYSKNGTGTGAYVDILGTTQSSGMITGSYTAADDTLVGSRYPSIMDIGSYTALSLFVTVNLSVATDMLLKVQVQYADGEPWCDIQSVREDTGTVAAEHTFVAGSVLRADCINHSDGAMSRSGQSNRRRFVDRQ